MKVLTYIEISDYREKIYTTNKLQMITLCIYLQKLQITCCKRLLERCLGQELLLRPKANYLFLAEYCSIFLLEQLCTDSIFGDVGV